MLISERGNEFEFWPSRFINDYMNSWMISLVESPPSVFHVAGMYLEMHRRLGQIYILDRIMNDSNV